MANNQKQHNRQGYQRRVQSRKEVQSVKGSAFDGDLGAAFGMVLARLDQMDREMRIMANSLEAMREVDDSKRQAVLARNVEEKRVGIEGIQAAREEMIKLAEQNPIDENIRAQYIKQGLKEAEINRNKKRARFQELIKNQERGEIYSHENQPHRLTINGYSWVIKPGMNSNVPASFIELWNDRIEMNRYAQERMQEIAGQQDFGHVQVWRDAGRVNV